MNKVVMAVFPHADDAAGMCGGTLAKFAAEGWKLVLVRVTNDDKDTIDIPTKEETERQNTAEFQSAAKILGASAVEELGFVTDVLGDVSMVKLREGIVHLYRKYQPYSVFSFDPYAPYEPNLDHVRVAQAVEEGFWVSNFHLHYPEHLKEGYSPHAVCEHWYFARVTLDPNFAVDITEYFDKKVAALCASQTMMRNSLHQLQLQLKTWGRHVPSLDDAINGDIQPVLERSMRAHAAEVAKAFRMKKGRLAEAFRVERFGGWEEMFQKESKPLPKEPTKMFTRSCFDPKRSGRLFQFTAGKRPTKPAT